MKRTILAVTIAAAAVWPVATTSAAPSTGRTCSAAELAGTTVANDTDTILAYNSLSHTEGVGGTDIVDASVSITSGDRVSGTLTLADTSCSNVNYTVSFYDSTTKDHLRTFSVVGDGSTTLTVVKNKALGADHTGSTVDVVVRTLNGATEIDRGPNYGYNAIDPSSGGGQGYN